MNGRPQTVSELLTRQFYDWEKRARGWTVFPEPVALEPPFRPFYGHFLPPQNVVDDGLVETGLSRLAKSFLGAAGKKEPPPLPPPLPGEEPEAEAIAEREDLVELQVALPAELDIEREAFEAFLRSLHLCREPITFEILGTAENIKAQFAVHPSDAPLARQQLQAFFPDAVFLPERWMLENAWTDGESAIVEFGLGNEFMLPLASGKLDPFVGITGALAELRANELGLFQVIFQPARHPWAESIMRAVTDNEGEPFFANAPEITKQAEKKVAAPLYAAVVRIATQSGEFERAWQIATNLAGSLRVFANPAGNELIPLHNDGYPYADHAADVLRRQCRRPGMILSSEELIGFVHLPSAAVRAPKLARQTVKTKLAPPTAQQAGGLLLGHNIHAGKSVPISLTSEQRVRHCHLIGASGTGKSTLLYNLIKHDIESGQGLALLDPHGDLVDRVLGIIPEKRIGDVVLLDPSDEEYSVGFNFLSAHSELEKRLLASDLVSVFQRLSTSWGDQMASVLQNAILAFLESSRGGTIADLRRFLLEPAFRASFLETVSDPEVQYYWHHAFPQLSGNKSIGPVLTRLETFLSPKSIRYMVSQKENKLDFADILDSGKIFLAKLSQGLIGRENSYLLGTLLVAKFQQLAMSRQAQALAVRKDFWLYVDEFHNFITPSMAEILSGARKYRIGLILAHQELRQLQRDSEVASAVLSNPYTRIVFRVGDDDAKKLADGFASFEARDLQNLGTGEAICRVERSDYDFNLAVPLPQEANEAEAADRRKQAIEASRKRYGTPQSEIGALLAAQARLATAEPEPAKRRVKLEQPKVEPAPQAKQPVVETQTPPPVPEAPKPAAPAEPKPPAPPLDMGRGGAQHQAIQQRLKAAAEKLGFRATIEKQILEGQGSVDLLLERSEQIIACEISITTTIDHEVGNVVKCLKAGFASVAIVCVSEERLRRIAAAVSASLGPDASSRTAYHQPDAFIARLESLPKPPEVPQAPKVRRGYKVKRSRPDLTPEEQKRREDAAIRLIAEHLKRKPKPRNGE
ncbi:MAG: type IV secretion system DNA-binding domain-containing protein [Verrucomicrobia bacterium]|nr:type IV secretion system DNA-binding domain-containing protein [Verrucomicrobiota bacterium]